VYQSQTKQLKPQVVKLNSEYPFFDD